MPRSPEDAAPSARGPGVAGERPPRRLPSGRRGRGRRPPALRDEVPAVHRAGPGQGPRGHGVLPLQPAAVARTRSEATSSAIGRAVEEFHESNAARLRQRPFEMLATATHDTKLGEDTRARINVLSEIPDEWSREVTRWMRMNRAAPHARRRRAGAGPQRRVPLLSGACRYLAAAMSAGRRVVTPATVSARSRISRDIIERIRAYMLKAGQGSQTPHELADAERRVRAGRRAIRRPRADAGLAARGFCPPSRRWPAASPAPA